MKFKKIPLSSGKYAIVDEADYTWLSQWKWSHNHGYAVRINIISGRRGFISMHRLLAGASKGQITDHINFNTLDNRRANLRLVTHSQNVAHVRRRGIDWYPRRKQWRVRVAGRHIAYCTTEAAARRLYLKTRRELYREYA